MSAQENIAPWVDATLAFCGYPAIEWELDQVGVERCFGDDGPGTAIRFTLHRGELHLASFPAVATATEDLTEQQVREMTFRAVAAILNLAEEYGCPLTPTTPPVRPAAGGVGIITILD